MSPTPNDAGRGEVFRDLASGLLAIVLAAGLGLAHALQPGRLHADYGPEPGPALMPVVLLSALGLAGIGLLLRGLIRRRARAPDDRTPGDRTYEDRTYEDRAQVPAGAFAAAAMLAVFVLVQALTGFLPAALLLGAGLAAFMARQERRPLPRAALEGALVAAFLYALFRFVLSVPLP